MVGSGLILQCCPCTTEPLSDCLTLYNRVRQHIRGSVSAVQRFVMQPDMPVETALRVYRRYLKLEPSHTEEYIAYLKSKVS